MIQLCSILLFVCVINVSSQESTTTSVQDNPSLLHDSLLVNVRDELRDLKILIAQQDTRFAQLNTRIAQLNTRIAQQDTGIRDLKILIAQQDARIAQQNTKFAVQNVKISDQNTKIAEQDNTITEQNAKIKDLEMKIEGLENGDVHETQPTPESSTPTKEASSIFTRWGRRDCPETVSQLVYSEIAGGSHYTHIGGAAEYVCLPPDPIWDTNKHFNGQYWGYMYGTEYRDIPQPVYDFNVPCAVCRTKQYSTAIMIPARTQCYPGWQEAYHGELVTEYYKHAGASQYVCLDHNLQTNGTKKNENGRLMYPVRAKCGSLPCPPYEDNTLLTCVVCLK